MSDDSQTWSFSLDADSLRPVEEDVVLALDTALERFGPVYHLLDPVRIKTFSAGGPPVWSIGYTRVDGDEPYWLLLTYGFSGVLTPLPDRAAYRHEYSLAVPVGDEADPPVWAAALLQHLARYVLQSGAELKVGDNMPCMHAITQIPFAPEHHEAIPSTALDTLVVSEDPLLSTVQTPNGPVSVRRIIGVHPDELALIETWNCRRFIEEWAAEDPRLLTDPARGTVLRGSLGGRCRARATTEGSSVGQLYIEGGFSFTEDGGLELHFPGGSQAQRIKDVLRARLTFDRPLFLVGPEGAGTVAFIPGATFSAEVQDDQLVFYGTLADPEIQEILSFLRPDSAGATVSLG